MSGISRTQALACAALLCLIQGANGVQASSCTFPTATAINCQMTKGARWELNWTNDAQKGLVLNQITLTAKNGAPRTLILEQASLAEVMVSYDDNSGHQHHLSSTGLPLTPLTASDCPAPAVLLQGGTGDPLVCLMIAPRGYAWRGTGQIQGESLILFGASAAGGDTYIQQWVFADDGSIQPMLGVSGQLDPARDSSAATGWLIGPAGAGRYASNRFHSAYWRLDFAIGGQNNDLFQQFDHENTPDKYVRHETITDILTEGHYAISPEYQRFWVVKDKFISNAANGQKISFELFPHHTSLHRGSDPLTAYDVYITENKACEQFAAHNPTAGGCAAGLPGFVNGELITDPVVWMGSTWHEVPRAEDEAHIQTHWQGLILAPRDVTATSPFN